MSDRFLTYTPQKACFIFISSKWLQSYQPASLAFGTCPQSNDYTLHFLPCLLRQQVMTRVCLSVLLKISPFDWIRFVEFYCEWLQNNAVDSDNTNNDLSLFLGWLYSGPVIKTRQNVFIFVKATHKVLIQLLWMFPNQRWWNRFCAYSSLLLPVACCIYFFQQPFFYQFTVFSFLLLNFNKLIDFFLLIFGHLMCLKDTC